MNLTETVERQNEMRSDYGLYVVAVICFIIAGVFLSLASDLSLAATAIFFILGIIFAAVGYTMRPKVAIPTPKAPAPLPAEPSPPPLVEEKVEEAPVARPPPTEERVPSIPTTPPPVEEEAPTPAPALEEPAKVEEEKPAEKPIRRRRRKKAT